MGYPLRSSQFRRISPMTQVPNPKTHTILHRLKSRSNPAYKPLSQRLSFTGFSIATQAQKTPSFPKHLEDQNSEAPSMKQKNLKSVHSAKISNCSSLPTEHSKPSLVDITCYADAFDLPEGHCLTLWIPCYQDRSFSRVYLHVPHSSEANTTKLACPSFIF